MQGADQGTAAELSGEGLRIAIVRARFNEPITLALAEHCLAELLALGVQARDIEHLTVPGALEIPVALKALADGGDWDALIALGCVIRGETYHFDIVANESCRALMELAVDESLAVGNGILTVENEAQAWARARREEGDKGGFAARAALTMIALRDRLGA